MIYYVPTSNVSWVLCCSNSPTNKIFSIPYGLRITYTGGLLSAKTARSIRGAYYHSEVRAKKNVRQVIAVNKIKRVFGLRVIT